MKGRCIVLALLVLLLACAVAAQVPQTMNYQLMLTDDADQPLADQTVSMIFRLYDSELGGSLLWMESRSAQTNPIGVVSLILGEIVPIDFEYMGPMWLEVEVDGETLTPRRTLTSAAYARHAIVADLAGNAESLAGIPADAYALDDDLWQPGTLNDPSNPMEWTKLKNVPGGFADGTDDVGTGVGGSGTVGYVPRFTGATTVGNSVISEQGGQVGIGTTGIDARLAVMHSGPSPALWLGNTSSVHGSTMLAMERSEDMDGTDVLMQMNAPTTSTGGYYLRCLRVETGGWYTPFSVDLDGYVSAIGGMLVSSSAGTATTLTAQNWHTGAGAVAIRGLYEGGVPVDAVAVSGEAKPVDWYGYGGLFVGGYVGASGKVQPTGSNAYFGVQGYCDGGSGSNYGVHGRATGDNTNYGVFGSASGGSENWAGYFDGDVRVTGNVVESLGGMEIDHPLDPENRYLRHAYVGSPEMKTVYDGTVTLDASGEATVLLPDWFEALNRDFRYQLTPIGAPAPGLYVAEPVRDGRFRVAGGEPGTTVSWMVTGVRHDAVAEESRIVVEEDKRPANRGRYVTPEAHGAPRAMGIGHVEPKKSTE